MYFKNPGIKRIVESLLDSVTTIAQAEETLRLAQLSPDLEALIKELEEKIADLNRIHEETTRWDSFSSAESEMLVECFYYIKTECTRLWHELNGYTAILENTEGGVVYRIQLITQAKAILTARLESRSDETHPEGVTKWADVDTILQ